MHRTALFIAVGAVGTASAQGTRSDYARAEQFLSWNSQELSINESIQPHWLGPNRLWYRNRGPKGYEFLILDVETGQRRLAFDHPRLAAALSEAADTSYDAAKLPFRDIQFVN